MNIDLQLTVQRFGENVEVLRVYPLGDLHVGSEQFNHERFQKWLDIVKKDQQGVVVLVGDMLDNGLKNSKTNSYEQLRPREQKRLLVDYLGQIESKILAVVQGNHEYRSTYLTDHCPLYDALVMLDLEELYRENFGFLKLALGKKNHERQFAYTFALAHGKTKNKNEKFGVAIDGMDVFITGHTHQPYSTFPAKIVIDPRNETVSQKGYVHISVPSFLDFGGYALRDMYLPQDNEKFPVIELSGTKKEVKVIWR